MWISYSNLETWEAFVTKLKTSDRAVVKNYYTGEKWYLVSIDGNETYVCEKEYKKLKASSPGSKT